MHPSLRILAAEQPFRKPLIQFIGKRKWPSTPEPQHPHPYAPPEMKEHFQDFLAKFKSSSSASATSATSAAPKAASSSSSKTKENVQVFNEYWQAPERLWKHQLDEAEMEAITSGGASLH